MYFAITGFFAPACPCSTWLRISVVMGIAVVCGQSIVDYLNHAKWVMLFTAILPIHLPSLGVTLR